MSDDKNILDLFKESFYNLVTDKDVSINSNALDAEKYKDFSSIPECELAEFLYCLGETDDKEDMSKFSSSQSNIYSKYKMFIVQQFGGEGLGSNYYYVIKFNDSYICIPGWYDSNYGSELQWNDMYECKPVPVTKIEYIPV